MISLICAEKMSQAPNRDEEKVAETVRHDRGYDTAVSFSTGSGQMLIAVGTGGIASALSKGGSVARAASGSLIAFDAAGNAVGVVLRRERGRFARRGGKLIKGSSSTQLRV